MSQTSLPSYPTFDPDDEVSSLPQKWEEYIGGLEDLMAACAINDHQRKFSVLRFYGGEKLRKLEKQLSYDKDVVFGADPAANPAVPGAPDQYRALKEALTAHFAPCVNETFARFQFRSISQEEGESIDTFTTRLRTQAGRCAFHAADNDNQIRDQIVFGCLSKKIRRKALAENLPLDRLIQIARAEETARANAAEIEKSSDLHVDDAADVLKVSRKPGKYSSRSGFPSATGAPFKDQTPNPPRQDRKCFNCGGSFPHSRNKPCPAKGKTCGNCSKMNHFASVCKSKQNVLAAAATFDDSDGYDVTADLGEIRCVGSLIEKPLLVRVDTSHGNISFNPDTGADVTLIDRSTFAQLRPQPPLNSTHVRLMPYGASEPLKLLGCYATEFKVGHRSVRERVFVSQNANNQVSLLSRSASRALGLVTLNYLDGNIHRVPVGTSSCPERGPDHSIPRVPVGTSSCPDRGSDHSIHRVPVGTSSCPDKGPDLPVHRVPVGTSSCPDGGPDHPLLKDYADICDGVGCHKNLAISLPLKEGAKHSVAPPSRIPINLLPKVKAELDRLESQGVFESVPVDDNVQSVSRLVPVPKRIEGSQEVGVRITFDWRDLNKNLGKVHHQVMTVEELKAVLVGAKKFSQIDLKDAFYQLPLDEESKRLTTFSTPWGLKRSTRLIQGALPSSAICHEVLRRDLEGIPGAINIADNILVFGRGETADDASKDHDRALKAVCEMFRRNGLTINRKKCIFNASRTKFFGYVFSADGIAPDPDKVKALEEASAPSCKEDVRSFLGLAGFNSQFMPGYATTSEPLRNLTKKNVPFCWGKSEQNSFKSITKSISKTTMLSYFDTGKKTALFTDASPVGVNATLAQMDDDGRWRPVNIASRALNETERQYDQLEREAVAMHFGCKRFKIFLQGTSFVHFIDPEPLKAMMEKSKKEAPARIEKVRLKLQGFDSDIQLVKGKHNPADYLSRHPLPYSLCSKAERESFRDIQNHLFLVAQQLPEAITVPRVREEIRNDAVIVEIMRLLRAGERPPLNDKRFTPFRPVWSELSIGMDILLRGERVVLPRALIQEALAIAHQGHMGVGKTKRYLRSCLWFPGMDNHVEEMVKKCLPCQAVTPEPHRDPLRMTALPAEPWQLLAADIFGPLPSGEKILVLKCLRSKWPEIKVFLRNQSTDAVGVISAMEKIFATHGIPDTVRTDNGPPFNSKSFKTFAKKSGFHHQKVTPLWPEANGQAEAFMKCLGKIVRTARIERRDWKAAINDFLMAYRATPHPSTGVSPAQLMYPQRRYKTQLPNVSSTKTSNAAVSEFNRQAMQKAKEYADQKRKTVPSSLSIGDSVLVRQPKKNKLSSYYDPRPYRIVAIKGTMVSAKRVGHSIVRNAAFFKKIPTPKVSRRASANSAPQSRLPAAASDTQFRFPPSDPPTAPFTPAAPAAAAAAAAPGNGRIDNHEGDSGDEEFVDAEEGNNGGELGSNVEPDAATQERPAVDQLVPAEADPSAAVPADAPRLPAFRPSPGLAVGRRTFSLPNTVRPDAYNFRPRPGGRTD